MPRLAGGLLARIVAAFKTEYPDVMVSIHSGSASAVHNWISSGFCDTGLAMLSGEAPGIQVEPVMTMNCVAVLPKGHRLTKLKKLGRLRRRALHFLSSSTLRERIDAVFKAAKVERQTVAEASLGSSVCALVGAGWAWPDQPAGRPRGIRGQRRGGAPLHPGGGDGGAALSAVPHPHPAGQRVLATRTS